MTKTFIIMLATILPVVVVAQILIPEVGSGSDDPAISQWSAECQTGWNGQIWEDCSAEVTASSSGWATLSASAPACFDCRERYSQAIWIGDGHPSLVAEAECEPRYEQYCSACCETRFWQAYTGSHYLVTAHNRSPHIECGPTKGRIAHGRFRCQSY